MKKFAVVVAGGTGQRMGAKVPKQFLLLKGKPLLYYTLQAFLLSYSDMQIILVLPLQHKAEGLQIIEQLGATERVRITSGGETRFHSVQKGLTLIEHPSVVFVHDGVRCLISKSLIQKCYEQTIEKGSAVPAVAATDSIRIEEADSHYTFDRNKVRFVQTPQTFQSDILCKAFKQEYYGAFTDEATVVEASGEKVFLIDGEYNNIKVTRPIDLYIAEKLLADATF